MNITNRSCRSAMVLLWAALLFSATPAQKKPKHTDSKGNAVLWEQVDIPAQDLFLGPGGREMAPDLSNIKFISEEKGGHSKKFKITDGAGHKWVVKTGDEAQSETAAVRLVWALGYKSEINYLVPKLTIPGKGSFTNARLEARPEDVKRGENWSWGQTPFENTKEMQGLKIMMALLNNWDTKMANNVILKKGDERQYVISDLGATFGNAGGNSLPLFWRIGRSRNRPNDYAKARFVRGIRKDSVMLVFNGKNRGQFNKFKLVDVRWLADRLTQLSDKQIRDAFRAANYSQSDTDLLTNAVRNRISQLDRVRVNARGTGRQ